MNVKMLKYLVVLSGKEVNCIDTEKFFAEFPKSTANLRDLRNLEALRYITISDADDDIDSIDVNQKAINYFK